MTAQVSGEIQSSSGKWWTDLKANGDKNRKVVSEMMASRSVPMNYYSSLKLVDDAIQ